MDSAWKQRKPEARKILENAAESPATSLRFVWQHFRFTQVIDWRHLPFELF